MLEIAYAANILGVGPMAYIMWFRADGVTMLFGPEAAMSGEVRRLIASMWTGVVLLSLAGLEWERTFVALLVFEITYKIVFFAFFVIPLAASGRRDEIPWFVTSIFGASLIAFPILIALEYL
jgi:hypothetical protein